MFGTSDERFRVRCCESEVICKLVEVIERDGIRMRPLEILISCRRYSYCSSARGSSSVTKIIDWPP